MAKKTEKIHYIHEGVMQDMKAIYQKHKKRRGRSKYLLSVEAAVRKGNESLPIRLVFVRNRNNRKDWLAGDNGYAPYGGRSDSYLREALGDRGVLQGVQDLSALGEGLPCSLVRCHDSACVHCVHTVHVSGSGAT